jgi:diguanylate cyclase (GGDEF)-like protein
MNKKKWFQFVSLLTIVIVITCISGIAFYRFVVAYGVQNEEENIITRAVNIAALIDASKVEALVGNQEDQKSQEYAYVRAQLKSVKSINPDLRFVYIMKLRNNEVIFLVDAEPQDSEDYSAPGDVYDEPSSKLLNIFMDKQAFIEGPITDAWGRWISAHATIFDPVTEKVTAIIGLDVDANRWEKTILFYKVFGASTPLFFILVVIIFSTALFKTRTVNVRLTLEIRERKQAEEELKRLSYLDGLTGVANRRRFDEDLGLEWRRMTRDAKPLSLIMCDIDFFKAYNDTYGHQGGDDSLRRVANTLNSVVGRPGDLVARYGGEEFVVILPETDSQNAKFLAEKMRSRVESLGIIHVSSQVCEVLTISLGVATSIPTRGSLPDELISSADQALYEAKTEGRNRVNLAK